ncbi:MAG: N-acetyltransferase [Bacteroidota bacterium]|nr:N-acetyltransferase [Bacteroidota bacterium]
MENKLELQNNEFLRQFETLVKGHLARIEYAEQEKKIFLTKLIIPRQINSLEFETLFIKSVLEFLAEKNYKVVPTSPKIAGFVRKNKTFKSLLPVGIKL